MKAKKDASKYMIKHTPTPWKVVRDIMDRDDISIEAGEDETIAVVDSCNLGYDEDPSKVNRRNAAFIVRAVNAHEDLLELAYKFKDAIRLMKENKPLPENWIKNRINKVIAKAENK